MTIALVAPLLVVASAAAGPGYGVTITADATEAEAGIDCAAYNVTIENTGQVPGQHRIVITTETESNWTLGEAPPDAVDIAPGESDGFSFTMCPPGDADDGAMATLTLTAEVESDPATDKARASEDFTATYSATAGGPDGDLGEGNGTDDDVGADPGNDTDEEGETPGPTALLFTGTVAAWLAFARRSRKTD